MSETKPMTSRKFAQQIDDKQQLKLTDDIHQVGILIYTLLTDVNEEPEEDIQAIL